jgi:tetraacyldisaccharide 4'-kinase
MMRAPAFWWRSPGPEAWLLSPLGWIYGAITSRRMARGGTHAAAPVICVGNLVAGGAGKTPTAIAVARALAGLGESPVFLSRGYGGRAHGAVQVDPERHGAADVGDEPLLLARRFPTVVSPDRLAGARVAGSLGSVIVMDDGLQNPSLAKDLSIAVIDGETGTGNGFCIPAGPLRAPVDVQLGHVGAVVIVGSGAAGDRLAADVAQRGRAVLHGRLVPEPDSCRSLAGRRVFAFAGIARPAKFYASLRACGAELVETRDFADHHPYRAQELEAIRIAAGAGALTPVTTEKDLLRIPPQGRHGLAALPVTLAFDEPDRLAGLLASALAGARRLAD